LSSTTASAASTQGGELARRWHSTTFRLLLLYAVIFSLSVMVLLGVIGGAVTNDMKRETDAVMYWQLIYFDSVPDDQLGPAIRMRLEHEHMHTNYYGLFASDGRYIAGDVTALPPELPLDGTSVTIHHHALKVVGAENAPVVRAMSERRADGTTLVVARDITQVLRIRNTIINALVAGGMLCLGAGVAGGLALSMRQMRRVAQIRRVTQRISQGDLSQRLPIGGRDELDMLAHLVNHMLAEVERLMNEVKGACDGIAHDLRTPLAHVRTLLARISEQAGACDDETLESLVTRARTETDSLLERFRAMLRISEIGSLNRRGGFAELRLDELVREVGELYEPLAEDRSTTLSVEAANVEPIHGDRALLFEMLTNLVDNAIKFTPSGGTVRIALRRTTAGPRIDVTDNGPGIPEEERSAVLQRFYRATNARQVAGSGLGLSIVSAVVRVHDFSIKIADAEPGTRVTIECWSRTLA
jgi:signal transduction histidine kinase